MNKYFWFALIATLVIAGGSWSYFTYSSIPSTPTSLSTVTHPPKKNTNTETHLAVKTQPTQATGSTSRGVHILENFSSASDGSLWIITSGTEIDGRYTNLGTVDITGWSLRGGNSGKSLTIGTAGGQDIVLSPNAQIASIQAVGSPNKNNVIVPDKNDEAPVHAAYAIYLGATQIPWGLHDTIQLIDTHGTVVDTYRTDGGVQDATATADSLSVSTATGHAPLTVTFSIKQSAGGQFINFGDGSNPCSPLTPGFTSGEDGCEAPAYPQTFTHTYAAPGTYTVTASRHFPSSTLGTLTIRVQ